MRVLKQAGFDGMLRDLLGWWGLTRYRARRPAHVLRELLK